ncbi:MAG: hypothetical protein QG594_1865 [Bacteroidota bacterium]|nr:hypothetical protein [Bacteroidota bacterium]
MTPLEKIIDKTTGYKLSRQQTANFVMAQPQLLDLFFSICFDSSNLNHYKACWAMELMAYEKLNWFTDYLPLICEKSKLLTHDSAIRPLAKVVFLLIEANYKKQSPTLTQEQQQSLIETNFDWLINNSKVAAKVYAMRSLFLLGKQHDWIYPELKNILVKDFSNHTAAYKAVSKQVLKKLK